MSWRLAISALALGWLVWSPTAATAENRAQTTAMTQKVEALLANAGRQGFSLDGLVSKSAYLSIHPDPGPSVKFEPSVLVLIKNHCKKLGSYASDETVETQWSCPGFGAMGTAVIFRFRNGLIEGVTVLKQIMLTPLPLPNPYP